MKMPVEEKRRKKSAEVGIEPTTFSWEASAVTTHQPRQLKFGGAKTMQQVQPGIDRQCSVAAG